MLDNIVLVSNLKDFLKDLNSIYTGNSIEENEVSIALAFLNKLSYVNHENTCKEIFENVKKYIDNESTHSVLTIYGQRAIDLNYFLNKKDENYESIMNHLKHLKDLVNGKKCKEEKIIDEIHEKYYNFDFTDDGKRASALLEVFNEYIGQLKEHDVRLIIRLFFKKAKRLFGEEEDSKDVDEIEELLCDTDKDPNEIATSLLKTASIEKLLQSSDFDQIFTVFKQYGADLL